MNNGPKTFRPDFWTCVDDPARFLKSIWLDPKVAKFIPMGSMEKKIFDNETWEMMNVKVGECPNVIGYRRNEKFVADRFLFEDTINWGNHKDYGGGRSVMLPSIRILFLLGFRKVYLLGCDFMMSEEYTYHFDEQRGKGAVNCNMSTYKRLKDEYFPQLKPFFDAEGFEVYNCNPDSGLKVFPHISFDDAIKEASSDLGDVANERTWGMYSKPSEKEKWKDELPEDKKNNLKCLQVDKPQPVIEVAIEQRAEPVAEPETVVQKTETSTNIVQPPVDPVVLVTQVDPSIPVTPVIEAKYTEEDDYDEDEDSDNSEDADGDNELQKPLEEKPTKQAEQIVEQPRQPQQPYIPPETDELTEGFQPPKVKI